MPGRKYGMRCITRRRLNCAGPRNTWPFATTTTPNPRNEKALTNQGFNEQKMAEAQRFELWDLLQSAVFKTAALNHSATPPLHCGRHNTVMKHTVKLSV